MNEQASAEKLKSIAAWVAVVLATAALGTSIAVYVWIVIFSSASMDAIADFLSF